MSVANHKKTNTEIIRNSLVIESIKIIKEINPKFFVFENVPAFMKTICTDIDGVDKPISDAIENNLGQKYSYTHRTLRIMGLVRVDKELLLLVYLKNMLMRFHHLNFIQTLCQRKLFVMLLDI